MPPGRPWPLVAIAVVPIVVGVFLTLAYFSLTERSQAFDGMETPLYLPVARLDPTVTPTSTPTPTVVVPPSVIGEVPLASARCPNDIEVNPMSGYAYVANNGNNTMSIVQELNHINTVATGDWPGRVGVDPNSTRAFLATLRATQVGVYNLASFVINLPTFGETFDVVYNPVNNMIYASDLFSRITVYDGLTYEFKAHINLAEDEPVGWVLGLAVDTNTGLVYAANWELGKVFTIDGLDVAGVVQAGWGVLELAVDPNTGYVYGAHSAPNADYPHNISVMKDNQLVMTYSTGVRSMDVAVNPANGLAYFVNPDNNSVTILQGPNYIDTDSVGIKPWSVDVNPLTGRAYVANSGDNTISVFEGLTVVETLAAGMEPFSVGVDIQRNLAYVANRASHVECNGVGQCVTVCDPEASITVVR